MLRAVRLAVVSAVLLALAVGCSRATSSTLQLKPLTLPTTPKNDGRPGVE